ncbi:hypothetical protein GCM10027451_14000 [Geodermatophilus aquaeductus]|uniref:Uncharacterized protein n=1 Tax=Geodermatophilus aquaeductus TaxID=1564161 RepID=A0A521BEF7_9ACTN|nr:hypothetical protein [Geodermatophilus aquaeductus]SMO45453.1 hypothetical protein SAMN06273567_101695 [Geodermatophilus aquaeductus]
MTATALTPDRGALSGPASGALFLAGVAGALGTSDVPYPRPGSDATAIRRFFQGNRGAARVSATGQLLSAAALARFTASVVRLAAPAGRTVQTAAAVGGAVAVASLTASSALTAALTTDRAADDDRAVALHRRAFLAGGVVHGAGFGLLVGALGVAGGRTGLLSGALSRAALGSAAAGLLAPLYLVAGPAAWAIPAGRFSGLLISAVSGVRMARGRPGVRRLRDVVR